MEPVTEFPKPPTPPAPEVILGRLQTELRASANLITAAIRTLDSKTQPTTYQTFRWLGGALVECEKRLRDTAKLAEIVPAEVDVPEFLLLQIPLVLANAEGRFLTAFEQCKLDELPPGNPKEAEFERLLKIKWALNKAVQEAMQNFGALENALSSETYKLDITEEQRVVAWRAARRKQFEGNIADIEKQEAQLNKILVVLKESKAKVLGYLEENDQMTFNDIDPTKPVILGETPAPDEAAP